MLFLGSEFTKASFLNDNPMDDNEHNRKFSSILRKSFSSYSQSHFEFVDIFVEKNLS